MEADLAQWVANWNRHWRRNWPRVGLIPNSETEPGATLGPFLQAYIDRSAAIEAGQRSCSRSSDSRLERVLWRIADVRTIVAGHADGLQQWLVVGTGSTTIHNAATGSPFILPCDGRRKLTTKNPFEE